ncbi:zinc-binding dehydrogenase [Granulicella sp. 5B5]|uniref:zinc-dependent alcohol dehydrogenase family protein n=1 Tax=Granulicella sp. 5B5 TaxID=1617967 RepID=UPI0015F3C3FF|nr:zinc-dependent alcohol dehydrogenase family protein [Granulicella sp. 5B5]QMV18871.1 zinc-binding dehydrogenase [Granulicella sp. 5B5]
MRSYIVHEPNGPFIESDSPRPILTSKQVLVRIYASGVNPLDTKIRAAKAAHAEQPLPNILGLDMAGTIEEVGDDVSQFHRGDDVYGMVGGVGNHQGTLAEYIAVDASLIAHKPSVLSMREAAALPLSVLTAWEGLVDRAHVTEGQQVLIHAGAGGIGHVAVQLARAFGAHVYATTSAGKFDIVRGFGATPIDYAVEPVEEYVAKYTQGRGFDIVYDTVGGATLDASFKAVKRYTGHAVSCLGWGTHALAPLSFRGANYSGVFTLLPLLTGQGTAHHGEILAEASKLVEAGKLKPLLNERCFSPQEIAEAHAIVASGANGKVVIEMS